jgi:hypothetical protein
VARERASQRAAASAKRKAAVAERAATEKAARVARDAERERLARLMEGRAEVPLVLEKEVGLRQLQRLLGRSQKPVCRLMWRCTNGRTRPV